MADSDDFRELRIAPVMTGGTSLAVWMGGATAEIYRLVCSRPTVAAPEKSRQPGDDLVRDAYGTLLDLTETVARVDVITGTSAGGLNGALLAAAWRLAVPTTDFDEIGKTWLEVGDLEQLLRPPQEDDPPSLLRGDAYFTSQIKTVLDKWSDRFKVADVVKEKARTVDLVTTLTSVRPDQRSRTDNFGELLNEATHAHVLRFTSRAFEDDDWTDCLALAARTSASIPGVFEPSYLPVNPDTASESKRPNLNHYAQFATSRWAVDGGVVVNLPLTETLDRVFDMRAERDVRRVVLYVCPTPPGFIQPNDELWEAKPTLRESLATIVVAPRAEGISGDVDRIREHNRAVEGQRAARRGLAELQDTQDLTHVAGKLFELYRDTRSRTSVARTIELLATRRKNRKNEVLSSQAAIEAQMRSKRKEILPNGIDEDYGAGWKWGIAPVEQAVSIALDLVRRADRLRRNTPATPQIPDQTHTELEDALKKARVKVHDARGEVESWRDLDMDHWTTTFDQLVTQLPANDQAIGDWARKAYDSHPLKAEHGTGLRDAHQKVAAALVDAAPKINNFAEAVRANTPSGSRPHDTACELLSDLRAIVADAPPLANTGPRAATGTAMTPVADPSDAGEDPDAETAPAGEVSDGEGDGPPTPDVACGRGLLTFHVLQTVFVGDVVDREQPVELMQVSFNSPNCLDEKRTSADKLAGPELARLGAFLKHSWRANDWLWGRMDAAYRMVELLLDPTRLRQLARGPDQVITDVNTILGASLTDKQRKEFGGEPLSGEETDQIRKELEFLTEPWTADVVVPRGLPTTTRIIAKRLQTLIAQKELPGVKAAIDRSTKLGAAEPDPRGFRDAVKQAETAGRVDPGKVPELVQKLDVGRETVGADLGQRMLNRVALQGSAVAVNVLAGDHTGLPFVSRVAARLKSPLHALNSVASVMLSGTKLGQAATVVILGAAGAIVALRLLGAEVPSGLLVVAELLLAATVLVAMLRSGFVRQALVFAVLAAVLGLAIAGDQVIEDVVYTGTPATAEATLETDRAIELAPGSILRVEDRANDEDEGLINDMAASRVTIKEGRGTLLAEPAKSTDPAWKRWSLTNEYSAFRIGAALGLALFAVYLVRTGRRRAGGWTVRSRIATGAAALGAILIGVYGPRIGDALVTGTTGESWPKDLLVDTARILHGIEVTLVILLLVLVPMAIGYGLDRTLRPRTRSSQGTTRS